MSPDALRHHACAHLDGAVLALSARDNLGRAVTGAMYVRTTARIKHVSLPPERNTSMGGATSIKAWGICWHGMGWGPHRYPAWGGVCSQSGGAHRTPLLHAWQQRPWRQLQPRLRGRIARGPHVGPHMSPPGFEPPMMVAVGPGALVLRQFVFETLALLALTRPVSQM